MKVRYIGTLPLVRVCFPSGEALVKRDEVIDIPDFEWAGIKGSGNFEQVVAETKKKER